jgi:hypothetical protein
VPPIVIFPLFNVPAVTCPATPNPPPIVKAPVLVEVEAVVLGMYILKVFCPIRKTSFQVVADLVLVPLYIIK